jgi:pre-mRNA cleavage complex 2 protein Pcf11
MGDVEEYACALSELTVNSKPIISSLTILAQEIGAHNASAAASIATLVEKHIRTVRKLKHLPPYFVALAFFAQE